MISAEPKRWNTTREAHKQSADCRNAKSKQSAGCRNAKSDTMRLPTHSIRAHARGQCHLTQPPPCCSRGGWTWSQDMKNKWSRATNSRYLMYSSSSSPFICPVELDKWYHSKELALTISERPSTPSNPYVPEELWPLKNCGGCGRMARNSQNAPNCRCHNSIHHL